MVLEFRRDLFNVFSRFWMQNFEPMETESETIFSQSLEVYYLF